MKTRISSVAPVLLLLACSAPGFSGILYTDGPTDGTNNGFFIDGPGSGPFSQTISDSFVDTTSGIAGSLDVGLWVPTGTTPTALSWSLGTSAFASDISSGSGILSSTFILANGFGYDIYSVHVGGLSGLLTAGNTYYLTLSGGNDSNGDQFVAWDVNGGPSTCTFAVGGSSLGDCGAGGEAFTISTADVTSTPEPASTWLFGSGLLAVAGVVRRKIRK